MTIEENLQAGATRVTEGVAKQRTYDHVMSIVPRLGGTAYNRRLAI